MQNNQRDPETGLTYLEIDILRTTEALSDIQCLRQRISQLGRKTPSTEYLRVRLHGLRDLGYLRETRRHSPRGGCPKAYYIRSREGLEILNQSKTYEPVKV